jgi:nanoRNase/pAp phosphatase (c-di-AMP/oligoRNAs hydrolase)
MDKLMELTEAIKGQNNVFIQMHNSPDPDAIGSAFGLQYLLSQKGIQSQICYKGAIDKYNTQKMIDMLGISVVNISEITYMSEEDFIVLVDSQKGNSNLTDFIGHEVASIDHHPTFQKTDYIFQDIRPEIGACSTIIAMYFIHNGISIPVHVATALLYGIKMDTLDLTRGVSHDDLDMFCMLYKLSEIEIINKIQSNTLQFEELIAYGNAIKNIKVYDNVGFANVGIDCPDSLLGTVADFIISIKEVEFAVVYSPRQSGIKFSVRNEIENIDAGKAINVVLNGIGNGGGHKTMAGGFLPSTKLLEIGEIDSFIEDKFLEIIKSL